MKIYSPSDLILSSVKAFNTGRPYGPGGQDLLICALKDGNVAMADLTRDLQYVYSCPPTLSAVLAAYDNSEHLTSAWFPAETKDAMKFAAIFS